MKNNIFRKLLKKNIHYLCIEILCAYGATKILLIGSQQLANAIDALFNGDVSSCLNKAFWMKIMLLIVLAFIFSFFKSKISSIFAINIQTSFREEAVNKLLCMQYRYLDSQSSASIMNKLISDIDVVSGYYAETLPMLLTCVTTIIVVLCSIGELNFSLTLFFMILFPIMLAILYVINKKISTLTKKHWELQDEVDEIIYDNLQGIMVGRSYNLNDIVKDRINNANDALLEFEYKRNRVSIIPWVMSPLIKFLPRIILGILVLWEVLQGELTIGEMSYFILLLDRIISPLSEVPNLLNSTKTAKVSKERLNELMKIDEEHDGVELKKNENEPVIEFHQVGFSYDSKREILKDISFNIDHGEMVAFVGESGGGKSTIFKLICGFYQQQYGEIKIYGTPITECNLSSVRRHIAIVSQNCYLFPETIAWNVASGNSSYSREQIMNACKKANIHDFISSLPDGYDTLVGERGDLLSGGEKQRISIARAFLKEADILLLDEPTSALDVKNEKLIKEAIQRVVQGKTVITIAHRLSTIKEADCIYVLSKGKICETGLHNDLVNSQGIYHQLYASQQAEVVK